jgi:predicted DNA-binding transcriptional regulator AlpA
MNVKPASPAARLEHLLTVQELSDYLGIPVATLYDWRVDHRGPKAVKLGHALRYPERAIRTGSRSGSLTGPVQPIGTLGTITVKKVRDRSFYASTRFRACNGGYIRFDATGATGGTAQRELKRKLADYTEARRWTASTAAARSARRPSCQYRRRSGHPAWRSYSGPRACSCPALVS